MRRTFKQSKLPVEKRQSADRKGSTSLYPPKSSDAISASGIHSANRTGLPDTLKTGIEALSGMSLDDVRVHANSPKPAQLDALAYTQGTDIHVAPGQERYLPHEAWHVIQQKQGRVKPTMQMKQGIQVNDDHHLEHEADVMGTKALQRTNQTTHLQNASTSQSGSHHERREGSSNHHIISTVLQMGKKGVNSIKADAAKKRNTDAAAEAAKTPAEKKKDLLAKYMKNSSKVYLDNSATRKKGEDVVEAHLDLDQSKHQPMEEGDDYRIGDRPIRGDNRFEPPDGSKKWHEENTLLQMVSWAEGLKLKDGGKQNISSSSAINGVVYNGFCIKIGTTKLVLFHCYPSNK